MFKKIMSILLCMFLLLGFNQPVQATSTDEVTPTAKMDAKADVVFVIDTTGSMSGAINNVKANINQFVEYLDSLDIDLRIAVIEFKDITVSGEENSTILHELNHSPWHNNAEQIQQPLNKLSATGGGDAPETILDGLGKALDKESMMFRSDANKFVIALTDANFKVNNNYGYSNLDSVIEEMNSKNIYSSIITTQAQKATYERLYQETGGIFGDLTSDFSELLKRFADSIFGISTNSKKAIYILPGYMGSELYEKTGNKIWMDVDSLKSDVISWFLPGGKSSLLTRNSDGLGSSVNVDMTKDKYGTEETYKPLITKLQKEVGDKYDVMFFPYDWLGDLNDSARKLEENIIQNGYEKVILLTHSTGGLLASNFIAQGKANKRLVEKAILVAAPLYGTYTALQPVETGKTETLDSMLQDNGVPDILGSYHVIHNWVKAVTKNSPTTYQLFPSEEYIKLMPALYKDDFLSPVTTSEGYYNILNKSVNINANLTNGNERSHAYFRENVLKKDIISELQQVDTLLIGSSYGHMTPAIARYSLNADSNSFDEIILKKDGDGTVMGVSAFATEVANRHVLSYKDFKNMDHGDVITKDEALTYICNVIKGIKTVNTDNIDALDADDMGMRDKIKFIFQSDNKFNIDVYGVDGEKIDIYSDNEDIHYIDLAEEDGNYRSQLYVPNGNYKVEVSADNKEIDDINISATVATLDYDGYKTARATYESNSINENGILFLFDMVGKTVNVDNLGTIIDGVDVPVQKYHTSWGIDTELRLNAINNSDKIHLYGASIDNGDITADKLNWYSSDSTVVTVSESGVVSATGYGRAIISVVQNDTGKVETCRVTVTLNPTSIFFDDIEMMIGDKTKIQPKFDSDKVTEKNIEYIADKDGIVTIDEYGVMTALATGDTTITGTASGGARATFKVHVTGKNPAAVQAITISPKMLSVPMNASAVMTANIFPETAENKEVRWHVEDNTIAEIIPDGLSCTVKGLEKGTTKITAVILDGGYTDTSTITVIEPSNLTISGIINSNIEVLGLDGHELDGIQYAEIIGEDSKSVYLDPKLKYVVRIKVDSMIGFKVLYNGVNTSLSSTGELTIKLKEGQMNTLEIVK